MYVYLMKFSGKEHDENFYKVGFSCCPEDRRKALSSPVYSTEIVRECLMHRRIESKRREKEIHRYLGRDIYNPQHYFVGSTECFEYNDWVRDNFDSKISNIYRQHDTLSGTTIDGGIPVSLFLNEYAFNKIPPSIFIGRGIADIFSDDNKDSWVVIKLSDLMLDMIENRLRIPDEFIFESSLKHRRYIGDDNFDCMILRADILKMIYKRVHINWWYNLNSMGTDWSYPDLLFKEAVINDAIDFNSYV